MMARYQGMTAVVCERIHELRYTFVCVGRQVLLLLVPPTPYDHAGGKLQI